MLTTKTLGSRVQSVRGVIDWIEVVSWEIPREVRDGQILVSVSVPDVSQATSAYQWAGAEIRIMGMGVGQAVVLASDVLGGAAAAMEFPLGEGCRWRYLSVQARGIINGAVAEQMSDFLALIEAAGVTGFDTTVAAVAFCTLDADASAIAAAELGGISACR